MVKLSYSSSRLCCFQSLRLELPLCLLAWNPRQQLPLEISVYLPLFFTFLLSHRPANTLHWGVYLYLDALLLWQTRSSPGHPIDSVKVQVPHLVFPHSFLSAVLERGPLAPTSCLIIAPSTSWGFLSLLSTVINHCTTSQGFPIILAQSAY